MAPKICRADKHPLAHRWTPEEDEIVRTTLPQQAAQQLGLSPDLVKRRQLRLGVGLHQVLKRKPQR